MWFESCVSRDSIRLSGVRWRARNALEVANNREGLKVFLANQLRSAQSLGSTGGLALAE
ncbi:unnamed protein product [Protopolystoma xenopodis]|uniref:Uncharacterized protein n=1 Tax=Protopolystoma xenopodis TaxID=117903 RepID=A0A448X0D9_9PLAT|nr:unnamed protein product [Protopolystoma xenopodis]